MTAATIKESQIRFTGWTKLKKLIAGTLTRYPDTLAPKLEDVLASRR